MTQLLYVAPVDVFTVVADPTRRAVLDLLRDGERTAGELATAAPGLTQPAMSRHLRVLRDAGLVRVRVAGRHRVYRLEARPLADLEGWVGRYRAHWTQALDLLSAHLAPTPEPSATPEPEHAPPGGQDGPP
jgi:DNA-binding transcriptional ArsR family regulator